ncbi:MAG TPA: hypothetical protein VNV44_11720 [Solirubrobacteraceae bacterium]|nr:hypothetical protein [Solirubrobacteraceae bacterium]
MGAVTEAEAVTALKRWARKHRKTPTRATWEASGAKPSRGTIERVCGRWSRALELAGLEGGRKPVWTETRTKAALQRYVREKGRQPGFEAWNTGGRKTRPSAAVVAKRFGSWAEACRAVGVEPRGRGGGEWHAEPWSETTVVEAIRAWRAEHDHWPVATDWIPVAPGCPSMTQLRRVCGSWSRALRLAQAAGA